MDRSRGEWLHAEEHTAEPERTERLLARPFRLFQGNGSDALDSLRLAWFPRSAGHSLIGVTYDLLALFVQVIIGGLTGYGATLDKTDPNTLEKATIIIITTFCIQYSASLYIFKLGPSADRIDNVLTGSQFFLEGSQTLTIFVSLSADSIDTAAKLQLTAFLLGLLAIFFPLIEKLYDALVVQVSRCIRGEFSMTGCFFATVALLLTAPSVILNYFGLSGASQATDDVTSILDEGNNAVEITVSDNLSADTDAFGDLAGLATDLASGMGQVASDMFWITSPQPKHHQAAVALQRRYRSKFPTIPKPGWRSKRPPAELRRSSTEPSLRASGGWDTLMATSNGNAMQRTKTLPLKEWKKALATSPLPDDGREWEPAHHQAATALQRKFRSSRNNLGVAEPTSAVEEVERPVSSTSTDRQGWGDTDTPKASAPGRPGFQWLEKTVNGDVAGLGNPKRVQIDVRVDVLSEHDRPETTDPSGFSSPSKAPSGSSGFACLSAPPRSRISPEFVSHTGADIGGVDADAEARAARRCSGSAVRRTLSHGRASNSVKASCTSNGAASPHGVHGRLGLLFSGHTSTDAASLEATARASRRSRAMNTLPTGTPPIVQSEAADQHAPPPSGFFSVRSSATVLPPDPRGATASRGATVRSRRTPLPKKTPR